MFHHLVSGRRNKQIAQDLGTVEKTIKVHRSSVMKKMGARSLPDLYRRKGQGKRFRDNSVRLQVFLVGAPSQLLADFVAKVFCGLSRATLIRRRVPQRNFSLLLRWLEWLLRALIAALTEPIAGTRSA